MMLVIKEGNTGNSTKLIKYRKECHKCCAEFIFDDSETIRERRINGIITVQCPVCKSSCIVSTEDRISDQLFNELKQKYDQ